MAEVYEEDVFDAGSEEQQQEGESTTPWTVMLVISAMLVILGIILTVMELKEFYQF